MKTSVSLLFAFGTCASLWAASAPERIIVSPLCAATESWNQDDKMDDYIGGWLCGCDPLAWGQVAVYHALNHGVPSASFVPPLVENEVVVGGKKEARQSLWLEPYDWVAVRDRTEATRKNGEKENPVARLMYDFGIIGGGTYAQGATMATVDQEGFKAYFGFDDGYCYTRPSPYWNLPEGFDWDDMLHRILRVSLQVGAPLCTGIYTTTAKVGHMIVADGWGVDADGTEFIHVNYGFGGGSNGWWDWERVSDEPTSDRGLQNVYANVFPTALGSVVVGRVSDAGRAPIVGAAVTLTAEDGTVWTARTDAEGCYVFKNLPLVDTKTLYPPTALPTDTYTVAVSAAGYVSQSATVTVEGYIDDALRNQKNDEWEGKGDGKGDEAPIVYPIAYGGSVADFVLEPTPKTIVDSPAELAAVSQYAGQTVYVATGTYALTEPLDVPAGTTLVGGYNPATGVVDPLATPTRLTFSATFQNTMLTLDEGTTLDGFFLCDPDGGASVMVTLSDNAKGATPTVRNCVFSGGRNNYIANGVAATACIFLNEGEQGLPGCTVTHCTFVGTLGDGYTDGGGNWAGATARRPTEPSVCTADHECPAYGLDGRPLGKHLGALAPDSFGFTPAAAKALGYRLRLK